jgi:hypothetical protein
MFHRNHFFETGVRPQPGRLIGEKQRRKQKYDKQQGPKRENYSLKEDLLLTRVIGVGWLSIRAS